MKSVLTILFASCLISGIGMGVSAQESILFTGARIIDVHTGKLKAEDAIWVAGDTIAAVGMKAALQKRSGKAKIIDMQGAYVIPGLWDMHIHLEGLDLVPDNEALLPVFLAYGITTVRDCASNLGEQVLQWRSEIAAGKIAGPTIFTAGRKLEGKQSIWERDLEIGNLQELKDSLDWLDAQKVDFIKITENTLAGPLFLEAVKASAARGYRVSGHVPYDLTIRELTNAGFSSIEHASYLLRLGSNELLVKDSIIKGLKSKSAAEQDNLTRFNQQQASEAYKELAKKNLFVCPTLIGGRQLAYLPETDHRQDSFLTFLTQRFTSKYAWRIQRMAGETEEQKQQRKSRYQLIKKQLPHLYSAGLIIIAGSDAAALNTYVYPAESLWEEMELFQEAGLTPAQILTTATINGARYFGVSHQTGSIDAGKAASLVWLDENPLTQIQAVRKVRAVMHLGKFYPRSSLDNVLANAARKKQQLDASRK